MYSVKETMEKLSSNCTPNADEYLNEADGLIYCKTCHTPRQIRIPVNNGKSFIRPPVLCKCLKEQSAEKQKRNEERQHMETVSRLKNTGLCVPALKSCTFENDDGDVPQMSKARKYVENFSQFEKSGEGLLLWGGTGSGKTFMAASIANALIDREVSVVMTDFARILMQLTGRNEEEKNRCYERIERSRLLIIDDLGIERNTGFATEQIFSVIDYRIKSSKPMIITTNMRISDMKNTPNEAYRRIYERILERCIPIMVTGTDKRSSKTAENYHSFRSLLD